jgi:hypothetical protein
VVRQRRLPCGRTTGTIHGVAFKRFRYTIEFLRPVLTGYHAHLLERMHKLQDRMGRIHDISVLMAELEISALCQCGRGRQAGFNATCAPPKSSRLIQAFLGPRTNSAHSAPAPDQPFPSGRAASCTSYAAIVNKGQRAGEQPDSQRRW